MVSGMALELYKLIVHDDRTGYQLGCRRSLYQSDYDEGAL